MAKTYSPKKVRVIYAGRTMTGYMDGTFIKVQKTSDDYSMHVGADGEGARIESADESGSVTLTLMQTSLSNDVLSDLRARDKAGDPTGHGPLLIKDLNGATLISAAEAWIRRPPDGELSNDKGSRDWIFDSTALLIKFAGNAG
jgi:hypothetical protein